MSPVSRARARVDPQCEEDFAGWWRINSLTVFAEVAYQTGDQDFTAQLTQVISAKAEALFVPGYFGDAALMAKQLRQLGSKIPILGGDALDAPELMSIGGEAVEGLIISSFYSAEAPANDVAKKFVAAYKSKYVKTPNANGALGFDTYNMVVDAIRWARAGTLGRGLVMAPRPGRRRWRQVPATARNLVSDKVAATGVVLPGR